MSKLILFDFRCTGCKLVFEELLNPALYWTKCPKCGSNAQRILSSFKIDHQKMASSASASPETLRHFTRTHQQQREKEERSFARNGDYGKAAGSD